MKICFMCDLHLPFDTNALQYRVLDWAVGDIAKKAPDCIVFAGDVTCDGGEEAYRYFLQHIDALEIPFLYIPGNSDLRCKETADTLKNMASRKSVRLLGKRIFAVNDCDKTVSEEMLAVLEGACDGDVVVMHHPIGALRGESREKMLAWREKHSNTVLFYAHLHKSSRVGNDICLQAMDPDKAIGESACITYYDTDTDTLTPSYFFCPMPVDMHGYLGISCYRPEEDIALATQRGLKYLELRKNCIDADRARLADLIAAWRQAGGEGLSLHLPEVGFENGEVLTDARLDEYLSLIVALGVDRVTQHVPKLPVGQASAEVLAQIAAALADRFNALPCDIVVGVENMHMTEDEHPDASRRFGYTPEECLAFMRALGAVCRHKVGINFDIGHARNNAPYSQRYQISTWLSMLGEHIVGYHVHQIDSTGEKWRNHMPITDIYGKLISYGSLFRCWSEGKISKAPVIFEMRPKGAYDTTLSVFDAEKSKEVFDLHAHGRFSGCSKDDTRKVIETAIANGITLFGITDHSHGIKENINEYVSEVRALAEEYKDRIRVLCGIEVATLPYKFEPEVALKVAKCDYCLIEHITDPESAVGKNIFEFCEHLKVRCGIAHTDLFAFCEMYGLDPEAFFSEMAARGIFWEMNISYDSTHKYREHEYVRAFLENPSRVELVKRAGVAISIGFDSHKHAEYDGERVHRANALLKRLGLRTADEYFKAQ